jgi:SAM-dependent methyltransferase
MDWVGVEVHKYNLSGRDVLEVGSLNVNGSVRDFFIGSYIGLDMRDGPGVDVVGAARELPFVAGRFEVVVCTEMLEHDPAFWLSLAEMGRVLKEGGHLLLTTRGNGFGLHNEPSDYWRFMPASRPLLAELAGCVVLTEMDDPQVPGVFVHGVRA